MQRIAKSNRDDRCVIFYIIEFFTDSLILSTKAWYSTTSNTRKCKTLRGREVCHGASMSLLVLFTSVFSVKFGERIWFPTHPWKSLKVLELFSPKFKALKVLESRTGAWKCLNFIPHVLESPWIQQVKLRDISNFVKQHLYRTGMHIHVYTVCRSARYFA